MEGHLKQPGKTVVHRSRIRNQKYKNNGCSRNLKGSAAKPFSKEIWHGSRLQMMGHLPGTLSQNHPGQQASQNGVPQPHPGGGQTEPPAELAGIAYKNNG